MQKSVLSSGNKKYNNQYILGNIIMTHTQRSGLLLILTTSLDTSYADPPAHAASPHGWRKKNDPYYQDYSGYQ